MTDLQMISKLSDLEQQSPTTLTSVRVKTPRRILHFSDGILEEYSSDDEIDGSSSKNKQCDEVNGMLAYSRSIISTWFALCSI